MAFLPFSLGGNVAHESTSSKNSSGVDPYTQQYIKNAQDAATAAANGGAGPLLNGAAQYGTTAQQAGNLGFGALSGDPNAVSKLMNPYQQQVIDANNAQWARTNQQSLNAVDGRATAAGAFGGSRSGVAEGVALANNAATQQAQTAQLLQSGYRDAINQAGQIAGYGFQGAQLNSNLGFQGVGDPALWKAQQLKAGYMGPTGTYSDTENHGTHYGLNGSVGFNFGGGK